MSLIMLVLVITTADFRRMMKMLKSKKAYADLYQRISSVYTPEWVQGYIEENGLEDDDFLISEDDEPDE